MAARFGAKIIPFGVVGGDDVSQLLLDYDDQVKIPFLQSYYKEFNESFIKLRLAVQERLQSKICTFQ